jgi:hypothetical protein
MDQAGIEVHMLLYHKRFHEGLLAFYTFAHHAQSPVNLIAHDDGSLLSEDIRLLQTLYPGCTLIARDQADREVGSALARRGLENCIRLRKQFVLALKLLDVSFYAKSREFIFLDSDTLFFERPTELIEGLASEKFYLGSTPLFSVDVASAYTIGKDEFTQLIGCDCVQRCNTGIFRSAPISLDVVEDFLKCGAFWNGALPKDWYVEQTIYAMIFTLAGAKALPGTYAISPSNVATAKFVSGHFCGSPDFSAKPYYCQAIPFLISKLQP